MTGSDEAVVGASVVAAAPVVPAAVEAVSVLAVVSDDELRVAATRTEHGERGQTQQRRGGCRAAGGEGGGSVIQSCRSTL